MNQINMGKKHYISFHGGGIPQKSLNFEYEYKIADKVIMHNNLFKDNQIKLPVLNTTPKIKFKKNSKKRYYLLQNQLLQNLLLEYHLNQTALMNLRYFII